MDEAPRSCAGGLAYVVRGINWLQTFTNNEFKSRTTNMSEAHSKTILVRANSIKKYQSRCLTSIDLAPDRADYGFGQAKGVRPSNVIF